MPHPLSGGDDLPKPACQRLLSTLCLEDVYSIEQQNRSVIWLTNKQSNLTDFTKK